jgi:hypothetical protein
VKPLMLVSSQGGTTGVGGRKRRCTNNSNQGGYTHHNTWLTPWGKVLLEKPPVVQLLKYFPTFCGTRRFITMFTRARHWSLSWARWIQSTPPHPISLNIPHSKSHVHFPLLSSFQGICPCPRPLLTFHAKLYYF